MQNDHPLINPAHRLADNAERVLASTTKATKIAYLKRWRGWHINNPTELAYQLSEWQDKWLAGEYLYSTIRQYKAVVNMVLSYAYYNQTGQTKQDIGGLDKATPFELQRLYKQNNELGKEGNRKELKQQASLLGQTSSTKSKKVSRPVYDAIMQLNDKGNRPLLKQFFLVNTHIGLRPHEWQHAYLLPAHVANNPALLDRAELPHLYDNQGTQGLQSDDGRFYLLVKNAKHTHDRAYGKYRLLDINNIGLDVAEVKKFILMLREAESQRRQAGHQKTVWWSLKESLAHAKKHDSGLRAAIKQEQKRVLRNWRNNHPNKPAPPAKSVTLYSTRHQAVANAKKNLTPQEVAACFGHISVHTAEEHYGKKLHGRGGSVKPHPASLQKLMGALNENDRQYTGEYKVEPRRPTERPRPTPTPRFLF